MSLFISLKVSLFTSNKALSNFMRFREKYPNILLKIIDAEDVENKVLGQRVDIGITAIRFLMLRSFRLICIDKIWRY